jgi:hypothetical protein
VSVGDAGAGAEQGTIVISPDTVPDGRLNRAYRVQFAARGGVEPYSFSVGGGELPAGLEIQSDGQLIGVPTEIGAYNLTVSVEDAEGSTGSADYVFGVNRSEWLAVNSFPSTASTQTLLSLANLTDINSELIRIENESASFATFSPNGRYLIYHSFRSMDAVDWYIVDTDSAEPKKRYLVTNRYGQSCVWAPDSRKLGCPEHTGQSSQVVYFDTGGHELGPRVVLATGDRLAWAGSDNLIYALGDGEYARIPFDGGLPGEAQPLGVSGLIERQSSDGGRAVVIVNGYNATKYLADLTMGGSVELPTNPELTFSDDFTVAVSLDPSEEDPGLATYSIYSVSGLRLSLLSEGIATYDEGYTVSPRLFGNRLVVVKGSQVGVLVIDETGVDSLVVPGDFEDVRAVELDPTGRWLYFETGQRPNRQFDPATTQHWLTRIDDESPPELIGSGFLGNSPAFSIDGKRFKYHGYQPYSDEAVPFLLLDLSDPEQLQKNTLDIPLNWAESQWSPDGTLLSFIGGTAARDARPLLVVDATAPTVAPRTILTCSDNPAPLPGCPNGAAFQP